jgi:hypothetical protein
MRTAIIRICLAASLLTGILSGCSDDASRPDDVSKTTPPALPQVSTMKPALNFYGVETPTLDAQSLATGKPSDALLTTGDHSNFINAYVRAVFVLLGTFDLLDEPIGAFAVAMHSVPQAQDDGSYLWTYIFVDRQTDIEYSVFLYGTPHDDVVTWRMEVSSTDPDHPLDHFVWFTGESREDNTSGYWQFYTPVNETDGTEAVRVDWTNSGHHESTLMVTVNGEGLDNEGDTLTFTEGKTTSSIEFFDASEDFTSSIVWHANGTGSLRVPDYNGGATACWDQHQVNVACE